MTHAIIRCDASIEGGIGHLVRAVSVADAARAAGFTVAIAGTVMTPLARQLVELSGIDVVPARDHLAVLAAEHGAALIHIDSYTIGKEARTQLRDCGVLLSSMEDGEYGRRPADVVVDATIRAEYEPRPDDGSAQLLLGIRYAPMRPEVRTLREHRSRTFVGNERPHIVVVMGGTDATGAAATVAAICSSASPTAKITVISPRDNWEAVQAAGPHVTAIAPSPAFLELASTATLVVSASGTTAWELACIGVPTVLVSVVDNQQAGYEAGLTEGIARGLGTLSEVRANPELAIMRMQAALAAVQTGNSWAEKGMSVVDGLGANRIVTAWTDALKTRIPEQPLPLTARDAQAIDSALLLRWRNDPVTRAVSRSQEVVAWESHQRWFSRVLTDSTRELYVAERDGFPIGTVRFDQHEANEWEVSITLAPEARGLGLSLAVLEAGHELFDKRYPEATVIAVILPNNTPSQKLFTRAGYARVQGRKDGEFDVLARHGAT